MMEEGEEDGRVDVEADGDDGLTEIWRGVLGESISLQLREGSKG